MRNWSILHSSILNSHPNPRAHRFCASCAFCGFFPFRMRDILEKLFHLAASQTTIRTELLAGLTTFMTMSYIIFVQPAVLSTTGMDFGAVLASTCIVSAIGCFLMAFLANYPIAVAPALGHNFFFAFTVVAAMHY